MTAPSISKAGRWVKCPGSYALPRSPHRGDNTAAKEGTLAHLVAEWYLYKALGSPKVEALGSEATQEMHEHGAAYAESVMEIYESYKGVEVYIEYEVPTPNVIGVKGRADVILYAPHDGIIIPVDYKFGHRTVEPEMNYQLGATAFACGFEFEKAIFMIHQPRVFDGRPALREWEPTMDNLVEMKERLIASAAEVAAGSLRKFVGAHCRSCPGLVSCQEARRVAFSIIEGQGRYEPEMLEPEDLAFAYTLIKESKEYLEVVERGFHDFIDGELRSGKRVPGYGLASSPGRRRWKKDTKALEIVGALTGAELLKTVPISITDAERAVGPKGVALLEGAIEKGTPSLNLTPLKNTAKEIFSDDTTEN